MRPYDFFLPDTFAAGSEAFPATLEIFQGFNLAMAKESGRNVSTKVPWKAALDFLGAVPALGIKPSTFGDIGVQLVRERLAPARKARRRTYQSVLAFDVYMKQLETARPAFSTFFTNHVASSMHRYWAAAFPEDYEEFGYDPQWVKTYGTEIHFAMDKADAFFGRLADFADRNPEYVVWLTTSMGQAATDAQPVENQLYVTDSDAFMAAMGVPPSDWRKVPSMLPRFNFFLSASAADTFRRNIAGLEIAGQKVVYRESEEGFFSVSFGQMNLDAAVGAVLLHGNAVPLDKMGMSRVEIDDKSGTTAYHIPQGCLVIYDPRNRKVRETGAPLSTTEIAPALLKNFAVPVPAYMQPTPNLEALST